MLRTTWILVLKGALNLGSKTSRILVLGTLKIHLQNDGSVNVFKSSYPSSRLVFKTSLKYICARWDHSWHIQTMSFWVFLSLWGRGVVKFVTRLGVRVPLRLRHFSVSKTLTLLQEHPLGRCCCLRTVHILNVNLLQKYLHHQGQY